MSPSSRRRFLHTAGLAGAWGLLGLPTTATWAAGGATAKKMRLVFYTDVHAHPSWETPTALAQAAKTINTVHPDLVIAGGDLIYDGFEVSAATADPQWDVYMAMHRAVRAPVEAILGNHDLTAVTPENPGDRSADPRSVFRQKLSLDRSWRVIDADGYRFFLLDSVGINEGDLSYFGGISTEQLDWLATELGRTDTDTPLVIATHLPLLTAVHLAVDGAATPVTPNLMVVNNREVLELFDEHNLLLVLQGHLHTEEMLRWRGTTFITSGAICGNKWRGPKNGTPEGFGVVTLRPDRVEWEYRTYGWEARRT